MSSGGCLTRRMNRRSRCQKASGEKGDLWVHANYQPICMCKSVRPEHRKRDVQHQSVTRLKWMKVKEEEGRKESRVMERGCFALLLRDLWPTLTRLCACSSLVRSWSWVRHSRAVRHAATRPPASTRTRGTRSEKASRAARPFLM